MSNWHHIMVVLVLFIFLTKAIIPTGFMPHQNRADLFPQLDLCLSATDNSRLNAAGFAASTWSGIPAQEPQQDHHADSAMICVFSVFASVGVPPTPTPTITATAALSLPIVTHINDRSLVFDLNGPPLGSRAPPA